MKILSIVFTGLFLALFSFGQLQRVQLAQNMAFYWHDIVILLWLLISGIYQLTQKPWKPNLGFSASYRLEIAFFFVIFIGWSLSVKTYQDILQITLYCGRLLAYILFIRSLQTEITQQTRNSQALYVGFVASGLFILFWGYLQYFLLPDTRFLSVLGWDDHYYRLISTQFDPAFTGMLLVLTFGYLWQLWPHYGKNKYIFYLLLIGLIYGILLTYSRSSYLSFIFMIVGSYLIHEKKAFPKNLLIALLVLFLISIPYLPRPGGEGVRLERTSTLLARKEGVQKSVDQLSMSEWLIGTGLFMNTKSQPANDLPDHARLADNLLLTVFTGTGVIGFSIFILLALKWGTKLYQHSSWFFILTASIILHSMFNNTFLQPFVFLMWLGGLMDTWKTSLGKRSD